MPLPLPWPEATSAATAAAPRLETLNFVVLPGPQCHEHCACKELSVSHAIQSLYTTMHVHVAAGDLTLLKGVCCALVSRADAEAVHWKSAGRGKEAMLPPQRHIHQPSRPTIAASTVCRTIGRIQSPNLWLVSGAATIAAWCTIFRLFTPHTLTCPGHCT